MPTLTLDWDDEVYEPTPDQPWTATPCGGGAPVPDTWSTWIRWESPIIALGDDSGLYVIEDGTQHALYAGKALNFSTRFDARSRVFHEFGLTAAPVQGIEVRIATVTAVPNIYRKVTLAEQWLIRFLYCRDFAFPPQQLQNIASTGSFTAPNDGLSIRYDRTKAPGYLSDPWARGRPGWVNLGGNIVGFNYAPNSVVFP